MKSVKPDNMPWISPYLIVKNAGESMEFYRKAFGFEVMGDPIKDDSGSIQHVEMQYKDCAIMMGSEGAWGGTSKSPASSGTQSPVNLYVYCDNVDEFCVHAKSAGAQVDVEPEDMFWGDRMCKITDPDGHSWSFATKVG